MAATTYGLSATGLKVKSQDVIIREIQDSLTGVFGKNINFAPSSNFGQLVGIFSEREALLWQLLESVYSSQYPSGAEGSSVDNILALTNMKRNKATPTRTNPTSVTQLNGITLYGILAKGTAGTVIPTNSIIQTSDSPPLQFKTDSSIVIQAAINAIQGVYLSNIPNIGAFSLTMPNGVNTGSIAYNSIIQSAKMTFDAAPSSGAWTISLSQLGVILTTGSLAFNATASQIQAAVRLLAGYSTVSVSGDYAAGFIFDFFTISNPMISIGSNTTGKVISILNSIQSFINNVTENSLYPYTDAIVSISSQGYAINFGSGFLLSGQPSCGFQPQANIIVASNTLQNGSTVTNIKVVNSTAGANAQGTGTATCISTGPNFVKAKALDVIGSPVSGWDSVSNELDCLTGTNNESDTDALVRRSNNLQQNANGPLQSIIEKVKTVANVTAAVGSENVFICSLQKLTFSATMSSGSYQLSLNGRLTSSISYNATAAQVQTAIRAVSGYENSLVSGDSIRGFTIDFNGSFGGKELPLTTAQNNTTGVSITSSYGLSGKSFEIIAQGGSDNDIANSILRSKPAGQEAFGSIDVPLFDTYGNAYNIGFSRPSSVPIYVTINLVTDLNTSVNPKFNVQSISDIQKDIVNIGDAVGIGGLIIGMGTDGLIGAFNSVPGIISYQLFFDRVPNPTVHDNIQLLNYEAPVFETFLVAVSYS
jgi:hypothetical protein